MDQKTDNDLSETTLSVGDQLRIAREAKSLELRDVAKQTRQSQDTLVALETMQTDDISPTILRMQARTYARFLDLPEAEIVSGFADKRSQLNASEMPDEVFRTSRLPSRTTLIVGGATAAALSLGAFIFMSTQTSPKAKAGELAIAARVSPQLTLDRAEQVLQHSDKAAELSIIATRPAWIEVRGSDGTVFRSRTMAVGEAYYPRMSSGWTVTVRDAGAFSWKVDDQIVGPFGQDGTALFSISIDEATKAGLDALSRDMADREVGRASPR